MVLLAVMAGAMLLLVSGVALAAFRYGSEGGETLYGTLKADTIYGYGGVTSSTASMATMC